MSNRDDVQALLDDGLRRGLFTAAAAAVQVRGAERLTVYVGQHSATDSPPATTESLFDLASVSKTYVAAAIMRLIDGGEIDPDAPVGEIQEMGSGPGHERITMRMLLTHTAGFPSDQLIWKQENVPRHERLSRVLATPLESAPGSLFRYSCVGYICAGVVAERVTGRTLSQLVREQVTGPLELVNTGYGPVDATRAVATEDQAYLGRELVRGEVHDELNWYLGGQVGNAGLFATVEDVLVFAESFLDDSLLGSAGRLLMTTPQTCGASPEGFEHSMGLRISDTSFMGQAEGVGHTGFTGTMWWAAPDRDTAVALLTNRVHPDRALVDITPFRARFSELIWSLQ